MELYQMLAMPLALFDRYWRHKSMTKDERTVKALRDMQLACQWVADLIEGEMIECRNYDRTYLGFESISQKELSAITTSVNKLLEQMGAPERIGNSMGEIVPLWRVR